MKKHLLSLLLLIAFLPTMAQTEIITGRVIDTNGDPIIGVVVAMFYADSTYLTATASTVDGLFEMPLTQVPFQLQFDHISFERMRREFDTSLVGNVVMESNVLEVAEVVVKAYRPVVKVEEGKLCYDFEQLAAGTTATNAYEAISKLPGVDEKDGALQLAGVGAVTVIINGKPTSMTASQLETMLSSMPIERIKSAEVMYSAPPKYGVRGGAINLVVDQSRDNSYSGEVRGGYANHRKNTWGSGASFAISTHKWSTDAIYSYSNYYSPQQMELSSIHTIDKQKTIIEQRDDIQSRGEKHTARAAFDYTPTENSALSVVYSGSITPTSHSIANSSGSFVESISDKSGDDALHNIAVRYRAESGFDVGVDYSSYMNRSDGTLSNIYSDGRSTSFDVSSGQNVSRLNLHADMEHSLSDKVSLSYGVKGVWAEDKDFQYYSAVQGDVDTFNTDSRLTEWSTELYVGASRTLSKGSVSASLTGEYYNLQGDERWMLYPQANFMWMFDKDNILQANLSSDKTYPSYWMLQDAINYVDGYTEIHGNPLLKPKRDYSSQLVYIHKQRYIVALFFSQTEDYFTQNAYQSPDRLALIYKNINFDYSRQYGANVIVPFNIGKWLSSKATLTGLRMEQRCDEFYDLSFDRSKWVGVASLDNTIRLKDNLSFELSASYQSPAIQGLFDTKQSWGVDTGVKLSLLDKKLDVTAKCSDIFESRMPEVTQNYNGQTLEMFTGAYSRVLSINISYRFGGYTKKERKETDSSRFGH